ncbi:hypothetical protein KQX54_019658 [Cotesia glomerata]|uniref:EGF-like domain-containing protein n=1 Tax=Cotesia glomerata TaxID=32391 RepID=A0AAV7IH72_COTGL|nr:hypothetical protein KQX54_019658 [Cotesia glomerata]
MVKVQFFVLSVAWSIIIQLTGSAIGKTKYNDCASFGESCNLHNLQPCCEENLICKEERLRKSSIRLQMCLCYDGFERINNKCQQVVGNICGFDRDCEFQNHTRCSEDNKCVCEKNYIKIGLSCRPLIGSSCQKTEDCFPENSVCVNHICECEKDFVPQSYERCAPILYQSCHSDEDCVNIRFTKCSSNKKCVCEPYYLASKDQTSCLPLIGGDCEVDDDCVTENSRCYNRKCECKKYYVPKVIDEEYECQQTLVLGVPCGNHKDCAFINNSQCTDHKVCACRKNHYEFNNQTFCAPIINETCSSDKDCRFDHFHCFNFRCQCKPNFSAVSDTQCEIEKFVVRCSKNIDCGDLWHAECSKNNYCVCKSNNRLINKATCYPLLNGLCWTNGQCLLPNSVCIDYHCQCQSGFKAVATNLCIPG